MAADLLTVPEAASRLTIKPKTVYEWVRSRKIEHYRIGGSVRIPSRVIDALLKSSHRPAVHMWQG